MALLYYCAWPILPVLSLQALHSAFGLNRLEVLLLVIYMCMFGINTYADTYSAFWLHLASRLSLIWPALRDRL